MPGFSDRQVKPYRRPAARVLHEKRTTAVRQATSAASEAAASAAEKEKVTACPLIHILPWLEGYTFAVFAVSWRMGRLCKSSSLLEAFQLSLEVMH